MIVDTKLGKTTRLIQMSSKTNAYIVCRSLDACSAIFQTAKKMELNIPFPISYEEFINQKYHAKGIKGFLIDDVDMLVQYMSPTITVLAITLKT